MCGELCSRNARNKGSKTSPVIPARNKGICTNCDMETWRFVESDVAIKFCHGCKNFRPYGDFGSQGQLVRCYRCREYCRGYYQNARHVARESREMESSLKKTTSPRSEPESSGTSPDGDSDSLASEDNKDGVHLTSSPAKPKEAADEIEALEI